MNRRLRLLLVQEAMGGCGRHVADLVRGLDPDLFDVTVIHGTSRLDDYYRDAMPQLRERARMIPCDALVRSITPRLEAQALREVTAVIRDWKPDIVHCHSSKAGAIGRIAALRCHVPKVFYTPHAYSFQAPEFGGRKRAVFVGVERWLSRHATTRTFNVSEGERRAALDERLDEPGKFLTVVNGIADDPLPGRAEARAALSADIPADVPLIGIAARLVDQKDPMTSAAVVAGVLERLPDAHAAYVGDGPYEDRMRELFASRGLEGRVHLLGYRPDAERLVAAFDVSLLTSLYEGMPYSLIESLRAGVPIAATDVTGNDEVVEPGVNGTLFPRGDVEAGVDAVLGLLADPLPAARVRGTYLARFTADRMVRTIAEEYLR